jgi:2',3'-cyclic-nucleotide 2'-phosphodiesterase (5'-nucleotidase family)
MNKLFNILLVFLSVTLFSCAGLQRGSEKSLMQPEKEFCFLFTNCTMGMLEPEGCACRQQGGLAKRSGLITETREKEKKVLVFDTGNILSDKDIVPDRDKTVYTLIALNKMEIDALNIGAYDAVSSRFLKQKEPKLVFPLVSANIKSIPTKELIFKPYTIKETQGIKIGIFGLTSDHPNPMVLKNKDIFIDDPVQEASKTVARLKTEGCDIIILLSQLNDTENIKVAKQVQGIHFIFGSSSKTAQERTKTVENTMIFSPGTKGKKAALIKTSFRGTINSFYDISTKNDLEERLKNLKEKDREKSEDIASEKSEIESRLRSFNNKNSYTCDTIILNKNIKDDNRIMLLIEKYKRIRLRKNIPDYKNSISTVDLSGLDEEKKLMALRLMNEIKCFQDLNIASLADMEPFCKKLANIIFKRVSTGESEGKIRYRILQKKEQNKKNLDKNYQFQ